MTTLIKLGIDAMAIMLIFILFMIVAGYLLLEQISPGIPEPVKDKNGETIEGSISEKIFVPIHGVEQGMFIRSRNTKCPVLLFVHGGPGFPNYFLIEKFNPGLEEHFTVCYWEQRGGGISYNKDVTAESMTLKQLTADAIEVTNYLRKRFGKQKIYIMAWSGGTPIALQAAVKAPGLFHAYIAMGQMTRQSLSERMAYDFMMEQCMAKGDRRSVKALMKYNSLATEADLAAFYNSGTRDKLMHKLGIGTMRGMRSVFRGIFLPVWTCRAYTLREKYMIWKAKLVFLSRTTLKDQTLRFDPHGSYPAIDIPVYFMCGKYDLTVNIDLSKQYYDALNAPLKGFYTFENSAHGPLFEENERFMDILETDVLNGKVNMEDRKPELLTVKPGGIDRKNSIQTGSFQQLQRTLQLTDFLVYFRPI